MGLGEAQMEIAMMGAGDRQYGADYRGHAERLRHPEGGFAHRARQHRHD